MPNRTANPTGHRLDHMGTERVVIYVMRHDKPVGLFYHRQNQTYAYVLRGTDNKRDLHDWKAIGVVTSGAVSERERDAKEMIGSSLSQEDTESTQ